MPYLIYQKKTGTGTGGGVGPYWMTRVYNNLSFTSFRGVNIDNSGNVVAGGGYDQVAFFAKYNNSGVVQWQKTISSATLSGITTDSVGNIIITGSVLVSVHEDLFVIKLDTSGTVIWQRKIAYGSTGNDYGWNVTTDSNDNIIVSGTSPDGSGLIAKYNSVGTLQWQKICGTHAYGCETDSGNNILVVINDGLSTPTLLKLNSAGATVWQRKLTIAGEGGTRGVAIDSNDNVYFTGIHANYVNLFIAKYLSDGSLVWQRKINNAHPTGIAVNSNGTSIYVTFSQNSNFGLVKYNSAGAVQWINEMVNFGQNFQTGESVAVDAVSINTAGSIVAVGFETGAVPRDGGIFRINTDGTGLGTYGPFVYSTFTGIVESAGAAVSATGTLVVNNGSAVGSTSTYVVNNSGINTITYNLP